MCADLQTVEVRVGCCTSPTSSKTTPPNDKSDASDAPYIRSAEADICFMFVQSFVVMPRRRARSSSLHDASGVGILLSQSAFLLTLSHFRISIKCRIRPNFRWRLTFARHETVICIGRLQGPSVLISRGKRGIQLWTPLR